MSGPDDLQLPSAEPLSAIRRRCVFFVGGYDPQSPDQFFARLAREMRRFEATWGTEAAMQKLPDLGDEIGKAKVEASHGDLWRVETDFHFLSLDSIVLKDRGRPLPFRLLRYARAFGDYVASGAAFAIAAKSWRFGLYFLYPFAVSMAALAVAFLGGKTVAMLTGMNSALLTVVLSLAFLWPLAALLANRWSVAQLMDLWSFSLDFLRGRRPDAAALLDGFASRIAEISRRGGYDEILLVGHSTGGGLILDIAARTLLAAPGFPASSPRISLLTLGSTALKFGLHPAAQDFRRKVQSLVDEPRLQWAEYQCMTDPINFYQVDPVAAMRLVPRTVDDPNAQPFPVIRKVHMRDMLDAATYKRIKRNFLRVHYQFVMGNTQKYFYDFFVICFGPLPLSVTAKLERADLRRKRVSL
jgi:pimeloyl-ACP methyl ester carboxylesterase